MAPVASEVFEVKCEGVKQGMEGTRPRGWGSKVPTKFFAFSNVELVVWIILLSQNSLFRLLTLLLQNDIYQLYFSLTIQDSNERLPYCHPEGNFLPLNIRYVIIQILRFLHVLPRAIVLKKYWLMRNQPATAVVPSLSRHDAPPN